MSPKKLKSFTSDLENDPKELLEYLNLALEGANLGIWDWYLEDNSVKFDRRWAEMLGLDYESIDMELSTWESRVHPDDLESCYADIKAYMDGKTDHYENIHRMKHADGHWVYILDRGRFSGWNEEGKPTRFTGTHFDITNSERYRKKLSLFFENSPFGYAFCDMDGNLLEVNRRYEEITGYSFKELQEIRYWDITPKKYKADEEEQLKFLQATGRYGPYRKEYIQKNGNLIPVELNGFVIEDYDGVTGIWSTIEDLTDKKKLEDEVMRSSKLASLGVLAAGVAHEINNPLTIIKGYLTKMRKEFGGNKNLIESSERIDYAIDRIVKIVSGLRYFAHDDLANSTIFDAVEFLKGLVKDTNEIFPDDEIDFDVKINDDAPFIIKGVEGKLNQVISNILNNAKDATIGCKDRKISLETSLNEGNLIISIKDNGHGIAKENLERIFDPFFTTKDVDKGTGIGLYISHNIIKELGGTISVSSEFGKGTEFQIHLNKTGLTTDSLEPIKDGVLKSVKSELCKNVMVVDDEQDIRDLLTVMLEDLDFRIETFKNGREAFDAYQKNPNSYDLIISDIKMPEMTGPELLKKLRAHDSSYSPKVVFITGGVKLDLRRFNGVDDDFVDGFLYKPFGLKDIVDIIDRIFPEKEIDRKAS